MHFEFLNSKFVVVKPQRIPPHTLLLLSIIHADLKDWRALIAQECNGLSGLVQTIDAATSILCPEEEVTIVAQPKSMIQLTTIIDNLHGVETHTWEGFSRWCIIWYDMLWYVQSSINHPYFLPDAMLHAFHFSALKTTQLSWRQTRVFTPTSTTIRGVCCDYMHSINCTIMLQQLKNMVSMTLLWDMPQPPPIPPSKGSLWMLQQYIPANLHSLLVTLILHTPSRKTQSKQEPKPCMKSLGLGSSSTWRSLKGSYSQIVRWHRESFMNTTTRSIHQLRSAYIKTMASLMSLLNEYSMQDNDKIIIEYNEQHYINQW